MKKWTVFGVVLCVFPSPAGIHGQKVALTVHSYAGGDGPPGLVSNAVPFQPGAVADPARLRLMDGADEVPIGARVLARWPQDQSVRSLLLQFQTSFTEGSKTYTLEIGTPRRAADRKLIPVTWALPSRIFTLPPGYLGSSLIFWEQVPLGQTGFPAWDRKQLAYYDLISFAGSAPCARLDQYYDSISTTYQIYARTGDLKYLVNGRLWALHHRRDQIHLEGPNVGRGRCSGGYLHHTRYAFPQGLISDYFMFGDEEARRVSQLVVDNFYMTHPDRWYYLPPRSRGMWTEREAAFALIGILAQYEATGNAAYREKLRQRVAALHRMQVERGRRAWVHNLYDQDYSEGCSAGDYGSSPWMSGLLLEAIVKYHKLTGDPLVRESMLMALDDLKNTYLASGAHKGRSFIYLGCPDRHRDGNPDLDNLISHAYGYGYRLTGRQDLLETGMDIFNTSVEHGFTRNPKHYNQQFRSSGHFPAYIRAR